MFLPYFLKNLVLAMIALSWRSPRLAKPSGMRSSPSNINSGCGSLRAAARGTLSRKRLASSVMIWTTALSPTDSWTLPVKSRMRKPGTRFDLMAAKIRSRWRSRRACRTGPERKRDASSEGRAVASWVAKRRPTSHPRPGACHVCRLLPLPAG